MALTLVGRAGGARIGKALLTCVADHGSASHPYPSSADLLRNADSARNLADAVHLLCTLHGRQPGVVDHAANRAVDPLTRRWFVQATDAFVRERALLTRLAVVGGPVPGTPGSGDSQAAVQGQRHAIEMLAQSERAGCSLGAAIAVALDWIHVRAVLEIAAQRLGFEAQPYELGSPEALQDLADAAASTPAIERAIMFGAEQIAIQHRGLWDLLEARQQARAAA